MREFSVIFYSTYLISTASFLFGFIVASLFSLLRKIVCRMGLHTGNNVEKKEVSMKKLALVFMTILLAVTVVSADDFFPPEWRGGPLSVEAEWDFDFPPVNWYDMPPCYFNAVGGSGNEYLYNGFGTHAEVDYPEKWMWQPIGQEGGGITPVDGSGGDYLTFAMQNWVDLEPWKDVRIQITGIWEDITTLDPTLNMLIGSLDVVGMPVASWMMTDASIFNYDMTGWFQAYIDLRIWPNPDWEKIAAFIPEGLIIDQVYIDTISIPEPATIALLCLGGLMLRRKKA